MSAPTATLTSTDIRVTESARLRVEFGRQVAEFARAADQLLISAAALSAVLTNES